MQTQHDDFDDVEGQGAIPIVHDQDLTIAETRLALDVGLTRRFSASLMLPVRVVSTQIRYMDGRGTTVDLVTPSTHHRNETLTGIADPMLLGAATHAWGAVRLTGRAGLSIPLGRTEHDPFMGADMPHQHIQMGTGTVNPIAALEAAYTWDRWRLAAFGFTQQTFYESGKGYQAGDRYAAGIALRRALGQWSVRGGLEMQAETYERWHGVRYTDEGNQGRIDAMVATGASWAATDALTVDLALKIPFINHVVGGQLDMPALLELGVSWNFGAAPAKHDEDEHEHEHEHDHDHADEHGDHGNDKKAAHAYDVHALDTTGADVADLGKGGAAVALVPVRGKLTIFDFWAMWCEPCKTLEPVLVELAKKYPDRVAVRRIDVVDWDTPVVAQHLSPGGFDLPHIKIFDAAGKLVFEQSSGPGKLMPMIESIRALVEPVQPPKTEPAGPAPTGGGESNVPPTATVDPNATDDGAKPADKVETQPADSVEAKPADKVEAKPADKVVAKPVPKPRPLLRSVVVTERGFEPAAIDVPRGTPVKLRFHRKTERTCATELIFEHDGKRVMQALPLDKPVELSVTFTRAGTITYACAMNMIKGTINVR